MLDGQTQRVAFARESLVRLRGIAGRVTIAELVAQALDETAYLATLSGLTDGSRRCANVDKLLEIARRSKRIALGEFTAYLQDLSEREAREGEALRDTGAEECHLGPRVFPAWLAGAVAVTLLLCDSGDLDAAVAAAPAS